MNSALPNQKKLVPISDAAEILGVSIDTIRRWDKSGILHSERPDGKNRYFSLSELESHKSQKPLSISEVAKKLNISATTLRRLEARGILQPKRNKAGERVYHKDSLNEFLNSDYFLRKQHVKEKLSKPLQEEKGPPKGLILEDETPHSASPDAVSSLPSPREEFRNVHPPLKEVSWSSASYDKTKDLQRRIPASDDQISPSPDFETHSKIPHFLAISAAVFVLLVTMGLGNIKLTMIKSSHSGPGPAVLAETKETQSAEQIIPAEIKPEDEKPAEEATLKAIAKIKVGEGISSVNIRREPTTKSEKIGQAKNDDTFEFVSLDSDWYEVKLADGSTGFISAAYIVMEETNN